MTKQLAEEAARERYNDCLDPANVPQDARVVDAIEQALAKQREAQFSWLFSHCHAIGMTKKSISGTQEHDIALFTADLKERAEQSESTLGALQLQFELRGEIVEKLTRERYMYSQLAAKRDAAVAECKKDVERLRAGLRWYAEGHHYDLPDWEDCSGESSNWLFPPIGENLDSPPWMVDNGGVARAILEGYSINPNHAEDDEITIAPDAALSPRSDLPQCHPTWTECPLCHNDIKRMPEGCQFKPRSDMVSVPREPTGAMISALIGHEVTGARDIHEGQLIYRGLLAAAGAKA